MGEDAKPYSQAMGARVLGTEGGRDDKRVDLCAFPKGMTMAWGLKEGRR